MQVVGDGGFYFGGPSSVFSVAQQYKLPILVLLLDNTGWSAVKESTLRVFPQGEAKSTDKFQASLMPDAEFSKIARGVRRPRREGRQSGRRAGGAGALREGGARRPRGAPARAGDEALGLRIATSGRAFPDARPVSFQQNGRLTWPGNLNVMVSVAFKGLLEQFEPEYRQTTGFGFAPVYAPAGTVVKRARAGRAGRRAGHHAGNHEAHDRRRAGRCRLRAQHREIRRRRRGARRRTEAEDRDGRGCPRCASGGEVGGLHRSLDRRRERRAFRADRGTPRHPRRDEGQGEARRRRPGRRIRRARRSRDRDPAAVRAHAGEGRATWSDRCPTNSTRRRRSPPASRDRRPRRTRPRH